MSSNVIKFPKPSQSAPPSKDPQKAGKQKILPKASKSVAMDKKILGMLVIAISLFSLNFKFFSASENISHIRTSDGRGVASVQSISNEDRVQQWKLARKLASIEVIDLPDASVGVDPTLEDKVRYGVLANKAYVFQRDNQDGNVISIRLQSENDVPAYLKDPKSFVMDYGRWLNLDFASIEQGEEEVSGNTRISNFILHTRSGAEYAIRIERDIYQRLKSISQTQVAGNSFN